MRTKCPRTMIPICDLPRRFKNMLEFSSISRLAKLTTWQRRFCAGNGAERHRQPPLGKLRALSLSKRQAARRVAVATASNLSFVVRGGREA